MPKYIHYITEFDEQTENMPKRGTQRIRLNEASYSAICWWNLTFYQILDLEQKQDLCKHREKTATFGNKVWLFGMPFG